MPKIVKNVRGDSYSPNSRRFAVSFKIEGDPARYHFWADESTFKIQARVGGGTPTIYKNPDDGTNTRTQYLHAYAAPGRALVAQIDFVKAYEQALKAYKAAEEKEAAKQVAILNAKRLENAAPVLLAALKVLVLTPSIADWLTKNDPKALEQAKTAIRKASPTASWREVV